MTIRELEGFYKGKRVLVTGHTGFKGAWLCRMLGLAGAQVTIRACLRLRGWRIVWTA